MIDTGAAVSLLRKDVWDKTSSDSIRMQPWPGQSLVAVDGSPLTVHGRVTLPVRLGNHKEEVTFAVADGLTVEAILGLDFLENNQCTLDLRRRTLTLSDSTTVPLSSSKPSAAEQLAVSVTQTIRIPASSELEILAHITGAAPKHTYLLEQNPSKRLPVMVARALVTPTSPDIPVRLINLASEDVTLFKGTHIATMEMLDHGQICHVGDPNHPTAAPPAPLCPSSPKYSILSNMAYQARENMSPEQSNQLFELLQCYSDVFADDADDMGHTTAAKHTIETAGSVPIRQRPRRIPAAYRHEATHLIKEMLKKGTIQPSNSPWASPIVLVKKKNGSLRFCVDYRKLNSVTRKDAYPLPRIDDTLDTLANAQWFTTLDLISGYWQVEIADEDREKTAFCAPDGLFEFNVMPFGLCNAPATFQRLMDATLAGLPWGTCLVYLDDIIILGKTFEAHLQNIALVFERLRQMGLKLQPTKCSLCKERVSFLGHIVSRAGVTTDPEKTKRVVTWPTPTSQREVQQFLGLANYYRRFVKNFATIAKPLHRLTEKNVPFGWTQEAEEAFAQLKQRLTSPPILAHPDFSLPFILDTDASSSGIGAVLSQKHADGQEHVVAYASRTLSKSERRYCTTRRELLAVISFMKQFRPYLLGRHFTLRTDHGSLTWLSNFREPDGQLARWITSLQEYDFSVEHRQGRSHNNADALSRCPYNQDQQMQAIPGEEEEDHGEPVMVATTSLRNVGITRASQLQDEDIGPILTAVANRKKIKEPELRGLSHESRHLHEQWDSLVMKHGKLWRRAANEDGTSATLQLIAPREYRSEILTELHDSPTGGHLGMEKMLGRLRQRYYWPGFSADVKQWCTTCRTCAARKTASPHQKAPLSTIRAGEPMQTVAVDILGPLPDSPTGNRYVLVAMDYFTRWAEAYAIPNQEATTIARKLVTEMFLRFSPPEQLHSDQGRQFESTLVAEICKCLGIKKTRTTPYHPQCNGLVERFNRTLLNMLATTINDHPASWEDHLQKVILAYNTSIQATTGYTPFFLMFGREARLPPDLMYGSMPSSTTTTTEYAAQLSDTLRSAYACARNNTLAGHRRQKEHYDSRLHGPPYDTGDLVWVHNPAVPKGTSRKQHSPWKGPYEVVEQLSDSTYYIKNCSQTGHPSVIHFNRLKPYRGENHDLPSTPDSPPPTLAPSTPTILGQHLDLQVIDDQCIEPQEPGASPPSGGDDGHDQSTSTNQPTIHRYPQRTRRPPDRLIDHITI